LLNTVLGTLSSGVAAATGSYESIASATGTGSSNTITFSSIPSTYKHLQIRFNAKTASISDTPIMRFNSDSGSNYALHNLQGQGSAASASGGTGYSFVFVSTLAAGTSPTYPMVVISDIIDYASTTKNKTVRNFVGMDNNNSEPANGLGSVVLQSGLWLNTNAISSITISVTANFTTDSTFALYGIKG
jgi:hypothetical protein